MFQLPKGFHGNVIYKGHEGAASLDEIKLTSPTHFTDVPLDTRVTHVIHVKEWQITVRVTTIADQVEETFNSSDPFSKVEKLVQDILKDQKFFLYIGKEKVKTSVSIGSLFTDEFCELTAIDPSDAVQREKFLV